jgi:selenocysteine lyase/cysteine desulfurase
VEEIIQRARQAEIITIIDGAHTPGQIPLDLDALGADFYGGNLHNSNYPVYIALIKKMVVELCLISLSTPTHTVQFYII